MVRKARWAAPLGTDTTSDPVIDANTPTAVVRQIFSRRLWSMLVRKGWTQSELSRQSGISRDSISTYVRGIALPDPINAQKLATAFGITVQELHPASTQVSVEESVPSVELKQAVGSGKAWLRVNKEVSYEVAVKILALLEENPASTPPERS